VERMIQLRPDLPQGYVLRAAAKVAKKDLRGAEADFKKAIKVAPQDSSGYSGLGRLGRGSES